MKITIKYYRDVWQEDDGFTREITANDGQIIALHKQVAALALHGHTYAVLSLNDRIEARYYLHAESQVWKLSEVE